MPRWADKLRLKSFLSFLLQQNVNWSEICCATSYEATAVSIVSRGEDSLSDYLTQDVRHVPEKCRTDPDFTEKVYKTTIMPLGNCDSKSYS